jgi:recombination protein RecR
MHGALSPLDGVGPTDLKLDLLAQRVAAQQLVEVIVATNANVDGDATALYIARLLRPTSVRVTRLASGMPIGGELEYLDQATVGLAIANRRDV